MKNLLSILFLFSVLSLNAQTDPVQEWCNASTSLLEDFRANVDNGRPELIIDHEDNPIAVLTSSISDASYATIVKYTPEGLLLWKHHLYNVLDYNLEIEKLLLDNDNNLFVMGIRIISKNEGNGYSYIIGEPFVQKISPEGELLWEFNSTYEVGAAGQNNCQSATLDENGNLYVVGTHLPVLNPTRERLMVFSLDTDGQLRWSQLLEDAEGGDIILKDDQLYVAGRGKNSNISGEGILVHTFSKEGDLLNIAFNPNHYYFPNTENPKFDQNGNFYIAKHDGTFTLQKFDINANLTWQYQKANVLPDSVPSDRINDYLIDQDGNIYLTGLYFIEEEKENVFTVKLSPQGETIWENNYNYNAQSKDIGESLALFENQNLLVIGRTNGTPPTNYSEFLLAFDQNGEEIWQQFSDNMISPFSRIFHQCAVTDKFIYTLSFQEIDNTLFDQNLCKYTHDYTINLDTDPDSLDTAQSTTISIYPNPPIDQITIEGTEVEVIDQIQLSNMNGQAVLSVQNVKNKTIQLPESISNGLYFLDIKIADKIVRKKIIIQN
jgi:hypothetical protein